MEKLENIKNVIDINDESVYNDIVHNGRKKLETLPK